MRDPKKEIGERLKKARERKNLKQNRVALSLGIHNSTLAKYESGDREPDNETLKSLATLYEVTPNWILTGNEDSINPKVVPNNLIPYNPDNMNKLPILGVVRAGDPIYMSPYIEGYEMVEPEVLRGRNGFVLRVKGDSMTGDYIFERDKVIVVTDEDVTPSDIAVVAVNGEEATLKRVKCQGGVCVLTPSNTAYEPMIYPSDQVHIIGKVIQIRRDL